MKFTKITRSALGVFACALLALTVGIQAQTNSRFRLTTASSIKDVAKFESEFTRQMNTVINQLGVLAAETTVVHEKAWRDVVDETVYKHKDSKMRRLTEKELVALRNIVQNRFSSAINLKATHSLGQGVIASDFFTGKLTLKSR